MNIHQALKALGEYLNYPQQVGYCHGFSLKWLEACFLKQEKVFDSRMDTIHTNYRRLASWIANTKSHIKQTKSTSARDLYLLAIQGFYDSMYLYQAPRQYESFFSSNYRYTQQHYEDIANFAGSTKFQAMGGFSKIYSQTDIYTRDELAEYLDNLGQAIEQNSEMGVGILLGTAGHSMALFYTPNTEKPWKFMDINQYPSKFFLSTSTLSIANLIVSGDSIVTNLKPGKFITFRSEVIVTGKNPKIDKLVQALSKIKPFQLNPKKISSPEILNCAFLAAVAGEGLVLNKLIKHGANLNGGNSTNGVNAIWVLAYQGHAKIIRELAAQGVDCNLPNKFGATPLLAAVSQGHIHVIEELARHGLDANLVNANGNTALIMAALEGKLNIIQALANNYKVDFDKADKKGITALAHAAFLGHLEVVKELVKHKADFEQANNQGITPIFVAAQEGHHETVAFLLEQGAQTERHALFKPQDLAKFAAKRGRAVVDRMNDFIASKHPVGNDEISLTPIDIASIMGRNEIVQQLLEHAPNGQATMALSM